MGMIFIAIFVAGLVLLGYSVPLSPYTNELLFMEKYHAMDMEDSAAFYQLRSEMITNKHSLEDLGITLMATAALLWILTRGGRQGIVAPKSANTVKFLANFLPLISTVGYVCDVHQVVARVQIPWWADTLAIPLIGAPINFLVLLVWAYFNLKLYSRGVYQPEMSLVKVFLSWSNWWIIVISIFSLLFSIGLSSEGAYWYAIPSFLWTYFYLSLGALRPSS